MAWGQGLTAQPWGRTPSAPTTVPITYGAPAPAPKPVVAPAPHPVAVAPAPAPAPGPVPTNYLDSTYENQLNNATFTANQKIDSLTQQQGYANIDLQNALTALAHQQPIDTQRIQEAENSRGGFALGREGENIGNLNYSYQQRQANDTLNAQRATAARDAAIAAVKDGLSTEEIALRIAAADRAAVAAGKNPATGQSSAPLVPAPSLPASTSKPKAAPKPAPPKPAAPLVRASVPFGSSKLVRPHSSAW